MKSLTYAELDVPFCTLTYGISPCRARVTADYDPVGADFGTSAYLSRGAGLTGAADSKLITFSFWFRKDAHIASGGYIFVASTTLGGSTARTALVSFSDTSVGILACNAAGTTILDQRSGAISAGPWVHVLGSFDLNSSTRRHLYISDVSNIVNNVFTNDTIDFTMADWGVGALPSGSSPITNGSVADLWIMPGVYLDLTIESNRRKFIDADLNPVDLGATGAGPTGSAPLVFLSGDVASWHTNKGTGGGFTESGTLTADEFGTGADKCFNSKKTCQSRSSYDPEDVTFRFAKPTEFLPSDIDAIPSIADVAFSPATISLGENLGTRASLTLTFRDHPHSDTGDGYDKYRAERAYDPYQQGSYWGKFRARQPFVRGLKLRLITGLVGDALADMETRHFFVESFDGPSPDGSFSIVAKDLLKFADGDRAQAPVPSTGYLKAAINDSVTAAVLAPSGIGDSEYPAAGYATIGGKEVVLFTRSGDNISITRAQYNTEAVAHSAQDRVQVALAGFVGYDAANILYNLFVTYAGIDSSYIPLNDWQHETAAYLGNTYSGIVCEPTSVAVLASEIIKQAGLCVWWDEVGQQIRMKVLRGIITNTKTFDEDNVIERSLTIREQPEKRLSRVQVYFGQVDPTKPLTNLDNYRSSSLVIDTDAEDDHGTVVLETIFSRWIPALGRSVADRLADIRLARFRDPPRRLSFQTLRYSDSDVELGTGYNVEAFCIQDAAGVSDSIPVQATRVNPLADRFVIEAEEVLFDTPAADLLDRQITVDSDIFNVNLRTEHDRFYPTPVSGDEVTCTINAGVVVGSVNTSLPAFDIGTWPSGVVINLVVIGRIQGRGGRGGDGGQGGSVGTPGLAGETGGTALYTRKAINLTYTDGEIWSGGGGGGGGGSSLIGISNGGGGGGGAGTNPGLGGAAASPAASGSDGTSEAGGYFGNPNSDYSGFGGVGGGPGLSGSAGTAGFGQSSTSGGAAGLAGYSVDGISYVTVVGAAGDARGTSIN